MKRTSSVDPNCSGIQVILASLECSVNHFGYVILSLQDETFETDAILVFNSLHMINE